MNTSLKLHRTGIGFFALLFMLAGLSACTDRRAARPYGGPSNFLASNFSQVAEVRLSNSSLSVSQMVYGAGFLTLVGKPFAFARWDITSDPQNPRKIFSASDNRASFSPDPPFGGWTPDGYGSGGMAFMGQFAIVSGDIGASVIQIGPSSSYAQEVNRFPGIDSKGNLVSSPQFQWKAIVPNPNGSVLYGFTLADGYYNVPVGRAANGAPSFGTPTLNSLTSNGGPACCVTGAVTFNNRVFVGMRNQLLIMSFSGNNLVRTGTYTGLQASNLAVSTNYLFVQSNATASGDGGGSYADGIYMINGAGTVVNYFAINPLVFAVTPDARYLYADEGDGAVKIYALDLSTVTQ
jgi:hypothetical protein